MIPNYLVIGIAFAVTPWLTAMETVKHAGLALKLSKIGCSPGILTLFILSIGQVIEDSNSVFFIGL